MAIATSQKIHSLARPRAVAILQGRRCRRRPLQQLLLNILGALRSHGVEAPIYVALATICNSPPNETIRSAQRAVVDQGLGIFAGPDTDTIGLSDRYDGCHMAESGLIRHAELWIKALGAAPAEGWSIR